MKTLDAKVSWVFLAKKINVANITNKIIITTQICILECNFCVFGKRDMSDDD